MAGLKDLNMALPYSPIGAITTVAVSVGKTVVLGHSFCVKGDKFDSGEGIRIARERAMAVVNKMEE